MERISIASGKGDNNEARNFFFIFDKTTKNYLSLEEIIQGVDEIFALNFPFESSEILKDKLRK
jgi:hypothetical protein